MKNFLKSILLFSLVLCLSCTKVVVTAKEHKTNPVSKKYSTDVATAFVRSRDVLEKLGYHIQEADDLQLYLETRWQSTTSDSHYLDLFGRRDYSANQGSYFKVVVKTEQQGNYAGVIIYTRLKSVVGKLNSSNVLEKKFFNRLDTAMRSSQIEVTNVGMTEK